MRKKTLVAAFAAVSIFVVSGNGTINAQTPSESDKEPVIVAVQPGDNLSKIATAHQTTYVRLYDANIQIEHPDKIHPGQNVRVPAADEQLAARPIPGETQVSTTPTTKSKAQKKPRKTVRSAPAPQTAVSGGVWDRLAQCESGGNWSINTGNGYSGGLQFSQSSWRAVGGSGSAHQASKSEQIARAEMLKARQGWGAWPACSAKLGLR
jgi:LysM repeat protein